jgi:hypothetical protein
MVPEKPLGLVAPSSHPPGYFAMPGSWLADKSATWRKQSFDRDIAVFIDTNAFGAPDQRFSAIRGIRPRKRFPNLGHLF